MRRAARRVWQAVVALAMVAALPVRADESALAARVVVLANRDDADSVRVAEHYAQARGVPLENIIALPMSGAETIGWPEFISTIWEPLLDQLVRARWIDGIRMKLTDSVGRTKYAMSGHRIAYLVVCRGVPLRISHAPQFYVESPQTGRAELRTNAGAVDAELSLLARGAYSINGFVPNPLFNDDHPTPAEQGQVVKVSRLDGPSAETAMGLVDLALAAERTGLLGRAYVDLGGAHRIGERWLESVVQQIADLGFDAEIDRGPKTFAATARFDAPALYFGWYAGALNGPFAVPGFQFPPGAVALHIHSFSAATVRSTTDHWCGPLLARGVTATVGNVFEPYLEFTHRPDLLMRALARGETWGDAVAYAIPTLSWQAVAIGDPLYRPFGKTLEAQWEQRASLPLRLCGYATLRRLKQLENSGDTEQALTVARAEQRERPTLAVGFWLAQHLQGAGDGKSAAAALKFLPLLENFRADDWALVQEAADLLVACGDAADAVRVFDHLLRIKGLNREQRLAWLPKAIAAAIAAKDTRQTDRWRKDLAEIDEQVMQGK